MAEISKIEETIPVQGYGYLYIILNNRDGIQFKHITTEFTKEKIATPWILMDMGIKKTNLHNTTKEKVIENAKKEVDRKREIFKKQQEQSKIDKGPPASQEEVAAILKPFKDNWYGKSKQNYELPSNPQM